MGLRQADRKVEADKKRARIDGATLQSVEQARRVTDEFRRLNMPVSAAFDSHSHTALFSIHTPIAMDDDRDTHSALRFCSSGA
jgi:hypothetical protein